MSDNEYTKMARNAYETINREYTLPAAQAQAKMAVRETIDDMGMDRSSGSYFMAVL